MKPFIVALVSFFIVFGINAQTTETFTSSGIFTVPVGVTSITVECWGAGGGGATMSAAGRGGGGGGGAYVSSVLTVSPGNSFNIVIGLGGGAGVDGGNTSFDATTLVAQGGKGVATNNTTGGAGGLASASTGTIKYNGGTGGNSGASSGGGGGGAGSTGAGGNGGSPTAGTGTAINGGDGGLGVSGNTVGNVGFLYGGAGAGASRTAGPTRTGGSGANGLVTVTYSLLAPKCPSSTSMTPGAVQNLCVGDAANLLTQTITTTGSTGTPTFLYQWYYNTTNSNTVAGATLIGGATSSTYTPLSGAPEVGSRWYFCVGYATDNGCLQTNADQALASNSVEVTVNDAPAVLGAVSGSTSVNPTTSGLIYSITAVAGATSYTWTVPTGWSINSGQGTISVSTTSGNIGQDGNITVTVLNACGTSTASVFAVVSMVATDHSNFDCNACHIFHNAPGVTLTNAAGNSLLCQSCHVSGGLANNKPLPDAAKAIPGTSGNSHAWGVNAVNATVEATAPTDAEMLLRVDGGNIVCSTCHNQHNNAVASPYLRTSNADNAMCKDCHSVRNVGIYTAAPATNKGSHPVGVTYNGADSRFNANPTNTELVGGKVQCSSCHGVHDVTGSTLTSDGYLLRMTNNASLCNDCHTYGTHNGMDCRDCHQPHNTNKANIYLVKDIIATPNSGNKAVVFTAETGAGSFADGASPYNGVCEVCHTQPAAAYHLNNSPGTHNNGLNCTGCHPHANNFAPTGCHNCHDSSLPYEYPATGAHATHSGPPYNFKCATCHFEHGQAGVSEGTHPSGGSPNIIFDPTGLATRNGQDANTPVWNSGTKTCSNVYCHSSGESGEGTATGSNVYGTWKITAVVPRTPPSLSTYVTTPAWDVGSITCGACHAATVTGSAWPTTGDHQRNPHMKVCYWCHSTTGNSIYMGTYGTSQHVNGNVWFNPSPYSMGGTFDPGNPNSSNAHCGFTGGGGKTCWY